MARGRLVGLGKYCRMPALEKRCGWLFAGSPAPVHFIGCWPRPSAARFSSLQPLPRAVGKFVRRVCRQREAQLRNVLVKALQIFLTVSKQNRPMEYGVWYSRRR